MSVRFDQDTNGLYNVADNDAFDRGAPADQFFAADARQAIADAEEVLGLATGIIGSS